jgi:hypothetical protein
MIKNNSFNKFYNYIDNEFFYFFIYRYIIVNFQNNSFNQINNYLNIYILKLLINIII